jgi:hypothetical protein
MNAKRVLAHGLIAVGLLILVYVGAWLYGLVRAAEAAAQLGQRASAGPMLVWILAMVPVAMILITIGIVMRVRTR